MPRIVTDEEGFAALERSRWKVLKLASLKIAGALSTDLVLKKQAAHMSECGNYAIFERYQLPDGRIIRRLVRGSFCRVLLCPRCAKQRSNRLHGELCETVEAFLKRYPKHRAIFVTLTVKNCVLDELRQALDGMAAAFRKFTRLKRTKDAFTAWFRTLEVTRNAVTGDFHPHYHLLIMVPAAYFSGHGGFYISQRELAELWRRCLGVEYTPVVDMRVVAGIRQGKLTDVGRTSLRELCKYLVKPDSLVTFHKTKGPVPVTDMAEFDDGVSLAVSSDVIVRLFFVLRGRRMFGMSEAFREISAELKQPDLNDPNAELEERTPKGAVLLGRVRWYWDSWRREYVEVALPETFGQPRHHASG